MLCVCIEVLWGEGYLRIKSRFCQILPMSKVDQSKLRNHEVRKKFNTVYEGGSICNKNPFITPSTNVLGFNAICQTKDQGVTVIMVHKTLFYLFKFNMLQAF